jgi:hypothetical protein
MYRVDRVRRLRPPSPSAVVVPSAEASGETDRLATSAIPTPQKLLACSKACAARSKKCAQRPSS